MSRFSILILITVLESIAMTLVGRGVFFFGFDQLGFTSVTNLWLAFSTGAAYIIGALLSKRLSKRHPPRRILQLAFILSMASTFFLSFFHFQISFIFVLDSLVLLLAGLTWPLIESYISVGKTPKQIAHSLGVFNVAWCTAVPVAMFITGPLVAYWPTGLFLIPGLCHLTSLIFIKKLELNFVFLSDDHPESLAKTKRSRYVALLSSSRWCMLSGFILYVILIPLLPEIFQTKLGYSVIFATTFSAMMDAARLVSIVIMQRSIRWHGRMDLLLGIIIVMPILFFIVIFSHTLTPVLAGLIIFGAAEGAVYYCAIYYAMVIENAAVDAGATHEAFIGLGFTLGPIAGLVGKSLATTLGVTAGMLVGVMPMVLIGTYKSIKPLVKIKWHHDEII